MTKKKYRLEWTPQAKADLRSIRQYIAQDAPRAATAFLRRLRAKCRRILVMPSAAPLVEGLKQEDLRETYYGSYRIIYKTDEATVTILTVYHGARLLTDDVIEPNS